jgi:hypothetical protein
VPALLKDFDLAPHVVQSSPAGRQLGRLCSQRAGLGAEREILRLCLLAGTRNFAAPHVRRVVDDDEKGVRVLRQVEGLLLAVDADREALADVAFFGHAFIAIDARNRGCSSVQVPRENKALSVLLVGDFDRGFVGEEALFRSVGGHSHTLVERRPQRRLAFRRQFVFAAEHRVGSPGASLVAGCSEPAPSRRASRRPSASGWVIFTQVKRRSAWSKPWLSEHHSCGRIRATSGRVPSSHVASRERVGSTSTPASRG